ncbi:hypothetical protein DPMN_040808 [Dreissena polymorpha]|uniref:Uncharacterized protein n=1 Tax=Dreissena polymorpha TaxID=45954 RepID=A0A9D4CXF0_DREPO|nr:hypothetical protein DPMN_040808 [Dreissena polymorpha]
MVYTSHEGSPGVASRVPPWLLHSEHLAGVVLSFKVSTAILHPASVLQQVEIIVCFTGPECITLCCYNVQSKGCNALSYWFTKNCISMNMCDASFIG